MNSVNPSRFPLIGAGFHVNGVRAESEPTPGKRWPEIRTCLIDHPKDDDLRKRQEVWSYHSRNRGVVKSLLKQLPHVPFRVKKRKMQQRDIETERDRIRQTISKLPNISNSEYLIGQETYGRNTRTRPLGVSKMPDLNFRNERDIHTVDSSEILKKYDTNNNDIFNDEDEIFERKSKLPSLSNRTPRSMQPKVSSKFSENTKKVSFSMNDLRPIEDERCDSPISVSSTVSETAIESYGHTSYGVSDVTPRSVLDVYGNNADTDRSTNSNNSKKSQVFIVSDNHQKWFQRVVGDKELIASNDYENFARTSRPLNDLGQENVAQPNNKIPPEKQYSKSGWNVYTQPFYSKQSVGLDKHDNRNSKLISTKVGSRSVESRLNDQYSVRQNEAEKFKRFDKNYQIQTQNLSRIVERVTQGRSPDRSQERAQAQTQTPSRLADRLASKSPERQGIKSPDKLLQSNNRTSPIRQGRIGGVEQQYNEINNITSPSPRFMGEYKLTKSPPPVSPGRYFPIFPTDGTPMRKIGGKNKLQKTNAKQDSLMRPLQETDTYLLS